MPRRENIESQIFDYFNGKPIEQVRLVFGVVKHIMRKREKNSRLLKPVEEKVEKTA